VPDAKLRAPRDLATPQPDDCCYICQRPRAEVETTSELVRLFRRWQCRDRVDCYKAWRS
jgi:hypothetical protein